MDGDADKPFEKERRLLWKPDMDYFGRDLYRGKPLGSHADTDSVDQVSFRSQCDYRAKERFRSGFTIRGFGLGAILLAAAETIIVAAFAQDTQTQQALKLIIDTAGQICQSAPLEQTNEGITLSGDAKAKVGGIVGKLADLGISGNGAYSSGKSVGVLQKDLVTAIQNGNSCKLEVFISLEQDLLKNRTAEKIGTSQPQGPEPAQAIRPPAYAESPHPDTMQVSALARRLGSSQDADRYYALQQNIDRLDPTKRLTVDNVLDLLQGLRDPELRYDAIDHWMLPRLAAPLTPAEALKLLSGFPTSERTQLLTQLQRCIVRPIPPDVNDKLMIGIPSTVRPELAMELDAPSSCPAGWQNN